MVKLASFIDRSGARRCTILAIRAAGALRTTRKRTDSGKNSNSAMDTTIGSTPPKISTLCQPKCGIIQADRKPCSLGGAFSRGRRHVYFLCDKTSSIARSCPKMTFFSSAIRLSRSGLRAADKTIGSFLFAGPTGVGKTELARQLSRILGVEFLRYDMSEYMEKHAVSRLIGAPPGYVGFDQGGLLTEAITKKPHSVLLLDEIEKAYEVFSNATAEKAIKIVLSN